MRVEKLKISPRMSAVITPLRQDHQDFRADQRYQDHPRAKIQYQRGIQAHAAAQTHGGINPAQDGHHQQDAVSGKVERTDADQNRMQTFPLCCQCRSRGADL